MIKQKKLLSWLLTYLAVANALDVGSILDRVDPLIWHAAENSLVLNGKSTFTFKYIMVEPCRHISRFGTYTWESMRECESIFRDSFQDLLQEMQIALQTLAPAHPNVHTISKRSSLPFIAGYFVGDFISATKS